MTQQPLPVFVSYRDSSHLIAINTGNAVMFGQTLVHERIVRVQKSQRIAILEDDGFKKHLGFALHGLSEIVIKVGKDVVDRILRLKIPQVKPLSSEICTESTCALVGQHSLDLSL